MNTLNELSMADIFILTSVPISAGIVTLAVLWNFLNYDSKANSKSYNRSKVETFSMYAFVIICYNLIMKKLGWVNIPVLLRFIGAISVYAGMAVNLYGRQALKAH